MSEDWTNAVRNRGRCCACGGPLNFGEINLVQLDRYARWKFPAYGNILAREEDKRNPRRACAIICDNCLTNNERGFTYPDPEKPIKYAVEINKVGERYEFKYHPVDELEYAEPITEEDLEEPPLVFGLEERVRQFDELVTKAAELHPMTWCVKEQTPVLTMILEGRICYRCPFFVLNGGVCDPL